MLNKVTKRVLLIATGAAALIAGPASAGTVITYYAPGGTPVGYKIYCDSGALYQEIGYTETPYTSTSWVSLPC